MGRGVLLASDDGYVWEGVDRNMKMILPGDDNDYSYCNLGIYCGDGNNSIIVVITVMIIRKKIIKKMLV